MKIGQNKFLKDLNTFGIEAATKFLIGIKHAEGIENHEDETE